MQPPKGELCYPIGGKSTVSLREFCLCIQILTCYKPY